MPDHPAPAEPPRYWTLARLLIAVAMVVGVLGPMTYLLVERVRTFAAKPGSQAVPFATIDAEGRPLFDLSGLSIPEDEVVRGGPSKDRIPALTTADAAPPGRRHPTLHGAHAPEVVPVTEAAFLADDRRVVGVRIHGQARAYPIKMLNYHECVNDVVGGVPIAVIYCPLCDSASVVDRRVGGRTLEFGISGLLYNSNVLLYDRTDEALWSQVLLEAVSGPNVGTPLTHLDGWEIAWFGAWRADHPDATVLTYDTGHKRTYEPGPYGHFFENDDTMFPVSRTDTRIARKKTPVIGVRVGDATKAYPVAVIAASPGGTVRDEIGGGVVVLSASDDGSVRIESVPAGGEALHTFWYAWAAMHPGTAIYTAE